MEARLLELRISPPTVEFDVPSDGSTEVEFFASHFDGDLEISLEDIPLTVEPTLVPISAEGTRFILTFYGDKSLGSQIFNGKIRFLAKTREWYNGYYTVGIKVRATIRHIADGVPPEERRDPLDTFIRTMENIRPKCPVGAVETAWIGLTERVIEITPAVKILPPLKGEG